MGIGILFKHIQAMCTGSVGLEVILEDQNLRPFVIGDVLHAILGAETREVQLLQSFFKAVLRDVCQLTQQMSCLQTQQMSCPDSSQIKQRQAKGAHWARACWARADHHTYPAPVSTRNPGHS